MYYADCRLNLTEVCRQVVESCGGVVDVVGGRSVAAGVTRSTISVRDVVAALRKG